MSDLLQVVARIWPYLLGMVILVVAFIAIILSSMVRRSTQAETSLRIAPTPEPGAGRPAEPTSDSSVPAGPLDQSFSQAGRFLRANAAGRDFRYQVPWFMVAGRVGSGKSSLLSGLGSGILFDEAPAALRRAGGLQWRFLDRGILLDVPGVCLEREGGVPGDERAWLRFLRLLERNRPRRPLDGIILTIPASDLVGPGALSEARLTDQATRYAARFALAQRTLGFTFPVYVVVTKCDEIDGFASFFREMPTRCHDDMFGWASPYQLDTSFTPDWVNEAFDYLMQELQRLQSEIFVERSELEHAAEIFLFPDEFTRMRDPLRVFLSHLFRETSYRESFGFRGLFFCGDIADDPVSAFPIEHQHGESPEDFETPQLPAPAAAPSIMSRHNRDRIPKLVRRLFEQKVFPERGISRPLSRVFLARNRMVLAIQTVSLVLALILGLGLWIGYNGLSHDRDTLSAMLGQMLKLPRAAGNTPAQDPGEGGVQLLFAMAPSGPVRFHSAFMPTSWFSNTDDEITHVMAYGANLWILGTIERSLQSRSSAILTQFSPAGSDPASANPPATGVAVASDAPVDTSEPPPPANIESTAEYQRLILFVNSLKDLKSNADIYETLRHPGVLNLAQVRTLVRYLYGSDVGELQPNGHLAKALAQATGPAFQVTAEQGERASQIMQAMVDALFAHWFDGSLLLSDVENMRDKIGILEQGRSVGYPQLHDALEVISQAGNDFNNGAFRWAAKPSLDLTGPLGHVIQDPFTQKNPFLNDDVKDYAVRTGQEHLAQLQENLVKARTLMTGQLVEIKDRVVLTAGTQDLERGLENALNLPFMVHTMAHTAPDIPALGTHIIWHVEPLQEALRQIDIYNRFLSEGLKDEMAGLVSPLKRVALDGMSRSVQDLIAQAVTTETGNAGVTDEVTALQDASEPLTQLANTLNRLGQVDTRNRLLRLVAAEGINALTTFDDQLAGARPYSAKIENWTGGGSAALAAFAASAPADLTDYLTHQRETIKFLQQQSKPFETLLQKFLPNPPQQEAGRIRKWQGIIQDFEDYDQKSPTGNITLLEQFIRVDMNKITPDTSCQGQAPPDSGGYADFFVQQQARLYSAVMKRCEGLASAIVLKTYTDIADQFNSTLAGKYPFAPLSTDRNQPEATPQDIQAFYKLLDKNGKTARSILTSDTSFGTSSRDAVQFLDQMEGLRALIIPAGAEVEKEPPLTLDVTPQLRVNRGAETEGNQIIEWTLQIGGQIFHQNEPAHVGRWRAGNPIRLSLRWAKDSTYVPQADSRQPNLRALDRQVFFEYTNRWSLLTALKRQESAPADLAASPDLAPYVLRFRVPTIPDPRWLTSGTPAPPQASTLFVQFAVSLAGTKTRAVIAPFPVSAPLLKPAAI